MTDTIERLRAFQPTEATNLATVKRSGRVVQLSFTHDESLQVRSGWVLDGLLRLGEKEWVYLISLSSHAGYNLVLARDHNGRLYRSHGHVCSELFLHLGDGDELKSVEQFLRSKTEDGARDLRWESVIVKDRPANWAQRMQMGGVPNLHKVSDTLYRSAEPKSEGMQALKALGVKTIVGLLSTHPLLDGVGKAGLRYEDVPMMGSSPQEPEAVQFLQIVTDPNRTPVLVCCRNGADDTGTMCAVYRMAIQGWTKEEAVREMTEGGFGFRAIWRSPSLWFNGLDIEKIRKQAGIPKSAEPVPVPDKR